LRKLKLNWVPMQARIYTDPIGYENGVKYPDFEEKDPSLSTVPKRRVEIRDYTYLLLGDICSIIMRQF